MNDAWPMPDQSTIEKAAMVLVEEHGYFDDAERAVVLAKVLADPAFKLVVATIWAGRLPTPDAYHRVDAAWNKRMAQVNQVGAVLNTWQTWREAIQDGEPEAVFYDEVLAAISEEGHPMTDDLNAVGRRLVDIAGEAATIAMVGGALEAWRESRAIFTHDIVAAILVGAFENLPEELRVLDLRAALVEEAGR